MPQVTHVLFPICNGLVGISYFGAQIHFCEQGVKTNKKVNQSMLGEIIKPLKDSIFEGSDYCFQQGLVPAHKAKEVQQWLIKKVPHFILTSGHLEGLISILLVIDFSGRDHMCSATHQFDLCEGEYCLSHATDTIENNLWIHPQQAQETFWMGGCKRRKGGV